jgi:hypothetical protein
MKCLIFYTKFYRLYIRHMTRRFVVQRFYGHVTLEDVPCGFLISFFDNLKYINYVFLNIDIICFEKPNFFFETTPGTLLSLLHYVASLSTTSSPPLWPLLSPRRSPFAVPNSLTQPRQAAPPLRPPDLLRPSSSNPVAVELGGARARHACRPPRARRRGGGCGFAGLVSTWLADAATAPWMDPQRRSPCPAVQLK